MLQELFIKDFALIDELALSFSNGLTMITGETGAGKSIIVGALNLLIGGRASADLIRTGADEARVEAVFSIADLPEVKNMLRDWDIAPDGNDLIVRRAVSRAGKNRITIAGRPATLQMLGQLGGRLLDISGQYAQQLLLHENHHLDILDGFGNLEELRREYATLFATYQETAQRLTTLTQRSRDIAQRRDLLAFQEQEIARAALQPGEEERLVEEKAVLSHARQLQEATYGAYARLYEDDTAIVPAVNQLAKALQEAAALDGSIRDLLHELSGAALTLEECARSLRTYAQKITLDPQRLDDIEARLAELHRLKRKYGPTVEDVLAYHATIRDELDALQENATHAADLRRELGEQAERLWSLAETLTRKRTQAAAAFKKKVEAELSDIGFRKALFAPVFETAQRSPCDDPLDAVQGLTDRGGDTVRFHIAPNQGEESKPLSRIASGGELSRIVLAIKRIVARKYGVATLVFDEVDAGIGGAVAEAVGIKLRDIAHRHQVLCITHVPQIAVYGTAHFSVAKAVAGGRTVTTVTALDAAARRDEIARMLGGKNISPKTIAHAQEMLLNAQRAAS